MRRPLAIVFALLVVSTFVLSPANADAYAACNCTAWAHAKRPDLPMTLGNARSWAIRARAAGFPVSGTPRVGDVMVLRPGVQGANSWYGHVAYVVAVYGSRVYVSEMNGGYGCGVRRDSYHTG